MPIPTIIIPFGESTTDDSLTAVVELDHVQNVDQYGNELNEFIDSEQVSILVNVEPGADIKGISTSYGSIASNDTPKIVTRSNQVTDIAFKGVDDEYTMPHFPTGNIDITWTGREREVTIVGRKIKCKGGAGICDISYKYNAEQYILAAPNLNLALGEEFPVNVSFKVERQ